MALQFAAKAPHDVKRYSWDVPVVDGDALSSFSVDSASGVTVDSSDDDGNSVVLYLSGGTASTTGIIKLHAITVSGEEFDETIYIPILPADNVVGHSETAQTIIEYALRPITGMSGTATSDELADGLEQLNGMLAHWKSTGADVGAVIPLSLATAIYAPDEWILAIKNNLRLYIAETYGNPVTPVMGLLAKTGLQAIKNGRLENRDPLKVEYF